MLRAFKNGAIKDPVARRIEQKRLERLNRIKSTVKARGHNNARRAAMQRLNRRGGPANSQNGSGLSVSKSEPSLHKRSLLNRRHLRDVTNRGRQSTLDEHDEDMGESMYADENDQRPYDPNSAEAILARAKKATAEARAKEAKATQRQHDQRGSDGGDPNDDSFIRDANDSTHDGNELDASFDTLWDFHSKKHSINLDPAVPSFPDGRAEEEGDLESLSPVEKNHDSPHNLRPRDDSTFKHVSHGDGVDITKNIHVGGSPNHRNTDKSGAIAIPKFSGSPRVFDRVSSAGAASAASSRLGEDENFAFQAAWSAATPIQLHGADIDQHAKGINMDGVFSDGRGGDDTESDCPTGRETGRTEENVESDRGLDRHEKFNRKNRNKADSTAFPTSAAKGLSANSWAPPSLVNMEKNWERRGLPTWSSVNGAGRDSGVVGAGPGAGGFQNNGARAASSSSSRSSHSSEASDLQFDPLSRARRSDPQGLLAALEADPEGTLVDSGVSHAGVKGLKRSGGQNNLHGPVPHYATRTRARPAVLKPMLNQGTKERRLSNKDRTGSAPETGATSTKGSWRGGGCSDPHKAEERDNVLKVRRREQEAAREKARRWRKRRLKREAATAKEEKRDLANGQERVNDEGEVSFAGTNAAAAAGGSLLGSLDPMAKNEKRKSNEKRGENSSLSSLKAEKNEAAALLAQVMGAAADTKMQDQLHTHREDFDEVDTAIADNPEGHKDLRIKTDSQPNLQGAFAPPPESPSAARMASPKVPGTYTVPQLNLSNCEPDLSEEEDEDEDEPFMRSPAKFELD